MKEFQEDIYVKVKELLIEMGHDSRSITPNASFVNDLGFDSLEIADLIMQMEVSFNIKVPIEDLENNCQTVEQLTETIGKLMMVES